MGNKLVLCLDDEKIVLDSLKEQLRPKFRGNAKLDFAQNAEEAFEIIEEYEEDGIEMLLVISDWLMPGMKGDEFLVKLHKMYPDVIKIMLTGQADENAIQKAIDEANLYKCISKPWKKDNLLDTINEAIEESNMIL